MVCHKPLQASLQDGQLKFSKAKSQLFYKHGYSLGQLKDMDPDSSPIPCGQCYGCRVDHAKQWATRIVHEASLHEDNCFLTLTYSNEHVPKNLSLNKKHFTDFMKRLREHLDRKYNKQIRYFMCGEYGEKNKRPHFHAIIFGHDFKDKIIYFDGKKKKHPDFVSKELSTIWKYGISTIGTVTAKSAGYVASYTLKKIKGRDAKNYYGERVPEYATMSRNGAIGKKWLEKYMSDVYNKYTDYIVVDNKKFKIPRMYDQIYSQKFPEKFLEVKKKREIKVAKITANTTAKSLEDKDKNLRAALATKTKKLDSQVA